MKILVLSNFYPPYKIGGYELLCQEVVESLRKRGHELTILTSKFGVDRENVDDGIYRLLSLESNLHYYQIKDACLYPSRRKKNISHLNMVIKNHEPDIIFIWGMWSLTKELAVIVEKIMGSRVVYYLANPWPIQPSMHMIYWDNPANNKVGRIVKRFIRLPMRLFLNEEWKPINLRFEHAPCCSKALQDQLLFAGVPLQDSSVIYEGINLEPYTRYGSGRTFYKNPLSLVYVGILAPHKGVHTAIEAVARVDPSIRETIKFTILGTGHPQYVSRLHNMVQSYNLEDTIEFRGPIPRANLPQFLGNFNILLLPSIWEEPLALIMQEGLASGLVVVGTNTGGTKEIIQDDVNGLLFLPEDSSSLTNIIVRLANDRCLCERLSDNGQITAINKFDLVRMVDDLEAYLLKVVHETDIYH